MKTGMRMAHTSNSTSGMTNLSMVYLVL